MYRAPSPFGPEHQQRAQPYSGQIAPGQITYTTSTDSDGRVIYHPFKCNDRSSSSYQTPAGIISGVQWVPAEATKVLPPGAQPANSEFAAAWSRTPITKEEQKALKEWQRDEEKRRKKEEKEAKRQREKEQRVDVDAELRRARERDAQARERRRSFNQGGTAPFPTANPGYPATPYTAGYNGVPAATGYESREGKYSTGVGISDLDRQFGDLDVGNRESGMARPARYQMEAERTRKLSNNAAGSYPAAYPGVSAQVPNAYPVAPYTNPSPNMRPGDSPQASYISSAYGNSNYAATAQMARPTTPYGGAQVYPPGHVMEGRLMQGATPPLSGPGSIPAASGVSYSMGQAPFPTAMHVPDPNTADQGQLAAPEGFSRPINAAQAFTPFEKMKVQDMDDLVQNAPRMPAVLQPHDTYQADCNFHWCFLLPYFLIQDLTLAWTGRLPAPGRSQRKSTLAADLIDLWNHSFFFPRGVEVILYKGRERRSGPHVGLRDIQLPTYDDPDDTSSSSSSSEDSDSADGGRRAYMYGQQPFAAGQGSMADVLEQRRRRREIRAEKKRLHKEKKARRKAKAREKKYALYLACVPNGGFGMAGSVSSGMPVMGTTGMGGMGGVGGGMGQSGMPGTMAYGTVPGGQLGAYGASAGGMPGAYGASAGGMPVANQPGGYGAVANQPGGYGAVANQPGGYGAVTGGMSMTNQPGY
ncbi:hypothetical protein GGX14DRAFT_346039 [Mycena pura]|uniref:Uncharacterized protein n=1 Tax=Mycena pura TaxID=153505 RepID=A0AAD6YTP3_9AGAR|nr:hypothetical protein GGX14DRAFT_346039 [Mycena pura]